VAERLSEEGAQFLADEHFYLDPGRAVLSRAPRHVVATQRHESRRIVVTGQKTGRNDPIPVAAANLIAGTSGRTFQGLGLDGLNRSLSSGRGVHAGYADDARSTGSPSAVCRR
jgi:hypothetical protein